MNIFLLSACRAPGRIPHIDLVFITPFSNVLGHNSFFYNPPISPGHGRPTEKDKICFQQTEKLAKYVNRANTDMCSAAALRLQTGAILCATTASKKTDSEKLRRATIIAPTISHERGNADETESHNEESGNHERSV